MKYLITLLSFCLLLAACKPDKEILPNELITNPCVYLNGEEPNAMFSMNHRNQEKWTHQPPQLSDTVILNLATNYWSFRSKFPQKLGFGHDWYINNAVNNSMIFLIIPNRSAYSSIGLSFYRYNQRIKIHHVLTWKVDSLCNPKSKGYDSVSSPITFKFTTYYNDLASWGKYRMVFDTIGAFSTQDSITINFLAYNKEGDTIPNVNNPNCDDSPNYRITGLYTNGRTYNSNGGYISKTVNSHSQNYIYPNDFKSYNSSITNSMIICNKSDNSYFIHSLYLFMNLDKTATLYYKNYDKEYKMRGRKIPNDNITTYNDNKNNNPK